MGSDTDKAFKDFGSDTDKAFKEFGSDTDKAFREFGSDTDKAFREFGSDTDKAFAKAGDEIVDAYKPIGDKKTWDNLGDEILNGLGIEPSSGKPVESAAVAEDSSFAVEKEKIKIEKELGATMQGSMLASQP